MTVIPLHPRGYCTACNRAITAADPVLCVRKPVGTTANVHADCLANGKRRAPDAGDAATVISLPLRDNAHGDTPDIA